MSALSLKISNTIFKNRIYIGLATYVLFIIIIAVYTIISNLKYIERDSKAKVPNIANNIHNAIETKIYSIDFTLDILAKLLEEKPIEKNKLHSIDNIMNAASKDKCYLKRLNVFDKAGDAVFGYIDDNKNYFYYHENSGQEKLHISKPYKPFN